MYPACRYLLQTVFCCERAKFNKEELFLMLLLLLFSCEFNSGVVTYELKWHITPSHSRLQVDRGNRAEVTLMLSSLAHNWRLNFPRLGVKSSVSSSVDITFNHLISAVSCSKWTSRNMLPHYVRLQATSPTSTDVSVKGSAGDKGTMTRLISRWKYDKRASGALRASLTSTLRIAQISSRWERTESGVEGFHSFRNVSSIEPLQWII